MILLDQPPDREFEVVESSQAVPDNIPDDPSSFIEHALSNRQELKKLDEDIKMYREYLKVAKAARLPSIYLGAGYSSYYNKLRSEYVYEGMRDEFTGDYWMMDLTVALSLVDNTSISINHSSDFVEGNRYTDRDQVRLNIFDGSHVTVPIEEAKLALRSAEYKRQKEEISVKEQVLAAYDILREAQLALDASRKHLQLAEETYRYMQTQFDLGVITFKELLDSRVELVQAKVNLNATDFEYALAYFRLQYVSAML